MSVLTISAEEYPALCSWLFGFMRHDPFIHPDDIAVLERSMAEAGSAESARQGLAMAIADCMQAVANWPPETREAFDGECASAGLPSLSDMQFRFWTTIRAIQKRGRIRSEKEYYALREAVEMLTDPTASRAAWEMLAAFEERIAPKPSPSDQS